MNLTLKEAIGKLRQHRMKKLLKEEKPRDKSRRIQQPPSTVVPERERGDVGYLTTSSEKECPCGCEGCDGNCDCTDCNCRGC